MKATSVRVNPTGHDRCIRILRHDPICVHQQIALLTIMPDRLKPLLAPSLVYRVPTSVLQHIPVLKDEGFTQAAALSLSINATLGCPRKQTTDSKQSQPRQFSSPSGEHYISCPHSKQYSREGPGHFSYRRKHSSQTCLVSHVEVGENPSGRLAAMGLQWSCVSVFLVRSDLVGYRSTSVIPR